MMGRRAIVAATAAASAATSAGAAEAHAYVFCQVIHLIGDEKLCAFLKEQPLAYQLDVRNELLSGVPLGSFEEDTYTERNFPLTTRLLCRKEIEEL